jgi:hypothetical protein
VRYENTGKYRRVYDEKKHFLFMGQEIISSLLKKGSKKGG